MFNLREFVMNTITKMIGEEPEYKVREYALGWYGKSVITEDDMQTISERYEELNKQPKEVQEKTEFSEDATVTE